MHNSLIIMGPVGQAEFPQGLHIHQLVFGYADVQLSHLQFLDFGVVLGLEQVKPESQRGDQREQGRGGGNASSSRLAAAAASRGGRFQSHKDLIDGVRQFAGIATEKRCGKLQHTRNSLQITYTVLECY